MADHYEELQAEVERGEELRAEIDRLRAALETIAYHRDIHSDFPHTIHDIQAFAYNTLIVNEQLEVKDG